MDIAALAELKSRGIEVVASAERYRELAERTPALRDFYHALAVTYERAAREMDIMLVKAERLGSVASEAA